MIEPPPRLQHLRDGVLAAEEEAAHIDRHHAVPDLDRRIDHRMVGLRHDARVVVEHIHAAIARDRRRDRRLHARLARHIAGEEGRVTARRPHRAAVSSPASATTSRAATIAPSRAKISQATRPIPLPAPVMMHTLSFSRMRFPLTRNR